MYVIIWQYQVREEQKTKFEAVYASDGAWVELFKRSKDFLKTELLQDVTNSKIYITIDRWLSIESYEAFLSQWQEEYMMLDRQCEGLTEKESLLGQWNLKY